MKHLFSLLLIILALHQVSGQPSGIPDNFVDIKECIPGIILDIRYAGSNNFIGQPVKGYKKARAILTKPAAKALVRVQEDLKEKGYQMKIFDAYRPQRAVDHFIAWAENPEDTLTKQQFYPKIKKENLFSLGYIASRSGHSRGSTVDLTIVNSQTKEELDMGSSYDFFGPISHHYSSQITAEQKKNRQLLKHLMTKHGFKPYNEEWWHYTLANEPYPDTYFDFMIE